VVNYDDKELVSDSSKYISHGEGWDERSEHEGVDGHQNTSRRIEH